MSRVFVAGFVHVLYTVGGGQELSFTTQYYISFELIPCHYKEWVV